MMPGSSWNWSRTSLMIAQAARPTARIAYAVKRNTSAAPMKPPTNVSGWARSTLLRLASVRNALNRRNAARPALPTAYPFVRAFVGHPGHLDDARAIVDDRPERVHREDVRCRGKHPHRRDGRPVDSAVRNP